MYARKVIEPHQCHHCAEMFVPTAVYAGSAKRHGTPVFCQKEDCTKAKDMFFKQKLSAAPRAFYQSRTQMKCGCCGVEFFPESGYASYSRRRNSQVFCEKELCQQSRLELKSEISRSLMTKYLESGGLDRMLKNNPMTDHAIRSKARNKLLEIGHKPTKRGGNGTGLTVPQALLLDHLGNGWEPEITVKTRCKKGHGYPTGLKIDIACLDKMIAIEVDGQSHSCDLARERDARKDFLLDQLGWSVLRFKNQDVMQSAAQISAQCNQLRYSI